MTQSVYVTVRRFFSSLWATCPATLPRHFPLQLSITAKVSETWHQMGWKHTHARSVTLLSLLIVLWELVWKRTARGGGSIFNWWELCNHVKCLGDIRNTTVRSITGGETHGNCRVGSVTMTTTDSQLGPLDWLDWQLRVCVFPIYTQGFHPCCGICAAHLFSFPSPTFLLPLMEFSFFLSLIYSLPLYSFPFFFSRAPVFCINENICHFLDWSQVLSPWQAVTWTQQHNRPPR